MNIIEQSAMLFSIGKHPFRFTLYILFVSCASALSQEQMNFQEVKIPNTTMDLYSAVEDDDGFIWIGKYDGLYRYNGLNFTRFASDPLDTTTITHGRTLYVVKGHEHDLWIGSNTGGVSRFDLRTHKFTNFMHRLSDPNSLGGNNIGGIAVDKEGYVWIGSDDLCINRLDWRTGEVLRFFPDTFRTDPSPGDYMGQVVSDPTNDSWLWMGSSQGVYRLNTTKAEFTLYPFETMQSEYKPTPVPVYLDEDGVVWAGSADGIVKIDPRPSSIEEYKMGRATYPLTHGAWIVTAIAYYDEDRLIVMTHHDGLILLNKDLSGYALVNDDPNLGHGSNFYLKDKSGNIWINDGALLRYSPRKSVASYLSLRHLPGTNWIRSMLPAQKESALYVGTLRGAGLVYVDFETREVSYFGYAFNKETNGDVHIRDLVWHTDSTIYAATGGGLLHFDPDIGKLIRVEHPEQSHGWEDVTSTCSCGDMVWFASSGEGVFALKGSNVKRVLTQEIFTDNTVNALVCVNGTIWAGTAYGLITIDPESDVLIEIVIPDIHISRLMLVDQTLWAATMGQGLFSIDMGSEHHITQHSAQEGGPSNLIYHLYGTNDSIWINTDNGVIQYSPATGVYRHHPDLGVGGRSPITKLPNGLMVTGAYGGLAYFDPKDAIHRSVRPKIYLTNINIANREEAFEVAPDKIESLILQPNEQELTIEFDAINFNKNSSTTFEYRIPGVIEKWQNLGSTRFLNIRNLPSGQHILEMKAINAYGAENLINRELAIEVIPPIGARPWFQITLAFALAFISYLLVRSIKKRRIRALHDSTVEYFANSMYAQNSVDEIMWDVARNVVSRLNFEDCTVYVVSEEDAVFVRKAAYAANNPKGGAITNPQTIPLASGIIGAAASQKRALLVPDVKADRHYSIDSNVHGSELAVPIIDQGHVIGVIDCKHTKIHYFRNAHVEVLGRIANECAHKIATAQAAEQIALRERQILSIEKQVAELKLTALQAQMNPHFIFNSLNSINWYILKNKPADASLYLTKFSKLVRLILDNSKSLSIPLDMELESLRLYVELESMRFANAFDYQIELDEELDSEEIFIPPLILQPFVENAIWHGLMPREEKGKLTIQILAEDEHLKCIVQDNGIGRRASARQKSEQSTKHESKGIKLTTDRIRLLHHKYLKRDMIRIIDLECANGDAAGTRVEVMLPYSE